MPKLIVERSKTFIFFFLFFLLSPKLSVVSFFFFDSFLPFFGEENDAVRCKCLACGRFFSQIAVVVVVDVSIDWKEVERMSSALLSVDLCPSLSSFSVSRKTFFFLDTTGRHGDSLKHHIAPCVCVCVNVVGSWLISARVRISKDASSFSPLQLDFPYIEWCIFRCVRIIHSVLIFGVWWLKRKDWAGPSSAPFGGRISFFSYDREIHHVRSSFE